MASSRSWSMVFAAAAIGAFVCAAAPAHAEPIAQEIKLAGFKSAALAADFPAQDLAISPTGDLWILGKKDLWQWRFSDGWLRKVELPLPAAQLAFDGASVYAAGDRQLFQFQTAQKKLLAYDIPGGGEGAPVFGFAGQGDELWLIHGAGLMHIDRYGKSLTTRYPARAMMPDDLAAFDPASRTLWLASDKSLSKIAFSEVTDAPAPAPELVLTTKHRLLEIALAGKQLVLHTERSVLRIDTTTGKTKKAIPVEGAAKLTAMAITPTRHAYLFDDRTVQVFDSSKKLAYSLSLPGSLDAGGKLTNLKLAGDYLAYLEGGVPRVFKISF